MELTAQEIDYIRMESPIRAEALSKLMDGKQWLVTDAVSNAIVYFLRRMLNYKVLLQEQGEELDIAKAKLDECEIKKNKQLHEKDNEIKSLEERLDLALKNVTSLQKEIVEYNTRTAEAENKAIDLQERVDMAERCLVKLDNVKTNLKQVIEYIE